MSKQEKSPGYHILGVLCPFCDTFCLFLHLEVVSAQEIISSSSSTGCCQPPVVAHLRDTSMKQPGKCIQAACATSPSLEHSQRRICTSTGAHYRAGRAMGTTEPVQHCAVLNHRLCSHQLQTKLSIGACRKGSLSQIQFTMDLKSRFSKQHWAFQHGI